jgi:hypothetical protein
MKAQRLMTSFLPLMFACLGLSLAAYGNAEAVIIGGFDGTRGGLGSLRDGTGTTSVEELRLSILLAHPDVAITATDTLTSSYMDSVDIVFLTVWYTPQIALPALSLDEQSALQQFVLDGGCALIFVDNSDLSDVSHESLLDPFGLDVEGKIDSDNVIGTIDDPFLSPATAGPFDTLYSYTTAKPGWFDNLGPYAIALDEMPNNMPSLAYIDFGVMGSGAGAVLLGSDSSHLVGLFLDNQTTAIVNNMIAACEAATGIADPLNRTTWPRLKCLYRED